MLLAVIRILIADDHEVLRKGARAILESHGSAEVCGEAADGSQALMKAIELRPDLVILDLSMPIMGGFQAAVEIRKQLPEMPVLFYTTHEGAQLIKEARRIGVQGLVYKSRAQSELLEAVEVVVRRGGVYFPDSGGVTALRG
jgi:two-component system, NarL family, nitrate/nitrite response regulator NarL